MILLLCGLVALAVVGLIMLKVADNGCGWKAPVCGIIATISCGVGCLGLMMYCVFVMDYIAAGHEARIINREYGTNYTQEEVFYAPNMIDTVRELDRKRMEINGDILKAK